MLFLLFQRKIEWVELYERYPNLYKIAMSFEKYDDITDTRFTWNESESLEELVRPKRRKQIKLDEDLLKNNGCKKPISNQSLLDIFFSTD